MSEETLIMDCPRDVLMDRCEYALNKGKFINIQFDRSSFHITAHYKQFVEGDIAVTLLTAPDSRTQLNIKVTSVDNIWARFEEPNAKIMGAFKAYIEIASEGAAISSAAPSQNQTKTPQEEGKCKNCGAVNGTIARFCEYCGSPLR
jgi:hypothetical protein